MHLKWPEVHQSLNATFMLALHLLAEWLILIHSYISKAWANSSKEFKRMSKFAAFCLCCRGASTVQCWARLTLPLKPPSALRAISAWPKSNARQEHINSLTQSLVGRSKSVFHRNQPYWPALRAWIPIKVSSQSKDCIYSAKLQPQHHCWTSDTWDQESTCMLLNFLPWEFHIIIWNQIDKISIYWREAPACRLLLPVPVQQATSGCRRHWCHCYRQEIVSTLLPSLVETMWSLCTVKGRSKKNSASANLPAD